MAGLFAQVTAPVVAALRRQAIVYGLISLGGLVVIFAMGYGLDAGRTLLMFRYGPVWASLIVAGILLAIAVAAAGAAMLIRSRRPRPASPSPPRSVARERQPYSAAAMAAAGATTAAVVTAIVVLVRSRTGRTLMARLRKSLAPA